MEQDNRSDRDQNNMGSGQNAGGDQGFNRQQDQQREGTIDRQQNQQRGTQQPREGEERSDEERLDRDLGIQGDQSQQR